MTIPLRYDISVVGEGRLKRVFKSVEREAQSHHRRMQSRADAGTRARGGTKGKDPLALAAQDESRIARMKMNTDARVQRFRLAELRRETRDRLSAVRKVATAEKAAARETARVTAASAKAAARTSRGAAGMLRRTGGNVVGLGGTMLGASGLVGGFAAAGAIHNAMSAEAQASALANQAYREGGPQSREQIRSSVLGQARTLGKSTGLGTGGMLEGLRNFVAISGDMDVGQKLAPVMADIADATDSAIGDVGRTAGQIVQSMATRGVTGDEAVAQTIDLMAAMAGQAKVGSIEFQDLATQMGKVMSATAGFDGNISELATTMGAIAQLSIAGGASSPEEAMTSIMRFRDDLIQNAGKFRKAGGKIGGKDGVQVFADEGKTKIRDPLDILQEMLGATGGNLEKISPLFGIRAQKAVQPFQSIFTEAGGGEAGLKAFNDLLDGIRGAKMSQTEIKESAGFRRTQSDKQFQIAVEEFNQAVGTKLLPVVTQLIPEFSKMIPSIAELATAFAEIAPVIADELVPVFKEVAPEVAGAMRTLTDTFGGVGGLIMAMVIKDIAMAGIGKGIGAVLEKVIGAAGGGLTGAVAAAIIAGIAIAKAGNDLVEDTQGAHDRAIDIQRKLMNGEDLSPEELLQTRSQLQKDAEGLMQEPGMAETVAGIGSQALGGPSAKEFRGETLNTVDSAISAINERLNQGGGGVLDLEKAASGGAAQVSALEQAASAAAESLGMLAKLDLKDPRRNSPVQSR